MGRMTTGWAAILAAAFLVGCAAPRGGVGMKAPDFAGRAKGIRTIGVVVVEARVIEIGADGSESIAIEKTSRCLSRLESVGVDSLRRLGYDAVLLPYDEEIRRLTTEYFAAHQQIGAAISAGQPVGSTPPFEPVRAVATARGLDAIAVFKLRVTDPTVGRFVLRQMRHKRTGGLTQADVALLDGAGRVLYYRYFSEESDMGFSPFVSRDKNAFGFLGGPSTLVEVCERLTADLAQGGP